MTPRLFSPFRQSRGPYGSPRLEQLAVPVDYVWSCLNAR